MPAGLKGYGLLTSTLGYDTGRKGFLAKLRHKYRTTELGAEYSDISKQTKLDVVLRPHPANKLAARCPALGTAAVCAVKIWGRMVLRLE